MKSIIFLKIAVLGLLSVLLVAQPARAQEPPAPVKVATWTLSALAGTDTLRLEGYRPSAALSLALPPGWRPSAFSTSVQLLLEYRISELAVVGGATLTVRVNKTPVSSILFKAAPAQVVLDTNAGSVSFDIPAELFQPGQNVVELIAFLPLEEDERCIVPNHPARWLEIGPGSRVNMSLEPTERGLRLVDFPAQFEAIGDADSAQITFVIPDEPEDEELNALSLVAFVLARDTSTEPAWSLVSADNFNPNELTGPAILLGAEGHNHWLDPFAPVEGAAGWLSLARPDWSRGEPVLAVGGADSQAVLQAAETLVDPLAMVQMSSDTAVVDELPPFEPATLPEEFSFADLGYSERVARGVGEHSLVYGFALPFSWSPEDGRMALHFAHSARLDPTVASLTVRLNGFTVSDILLDAPGSASNRVEFAIPNTLLRPGRNFLRLTFDFGMPVELCGSDVTQGPWASVRPDSTLTLPHGDTGGRIDLGDFPYLFASQVDLADLNLVLPSPSTTTDIADALRLVRTLSLSGNQSPFAPRWVRGDAVDEETRRSHLIALGDPARQPFLSELNPHLHLPFDLETGALLRTYGIRIPLESPDLGVVQIVRSPWEENRVVVMVAGTSAEGYAEALRLLTDPLLQPDLAGQLALISPGTEDDLPRIYTQAIPDVRAVPAVGRADRLLSQYLGAGSPWSAVILVVAALVLVGVAGAIALAWNRRRKASPAGGH